MRRWLSRRRDLRAQARELAYLKLVDCLGRAHAGVLHMPIGDKRAEALVAHIDSEMCAAFDALKDLEKAL